MLHLLSQKIAAVCPILGVSSSRRVDFRPEATASQRAAAKAIAEAWDFEAEGAKDGRRLGLLAELEKIDSNSIRAIREWIGSQPDSSAYLAQLEKRAAEARVELAEVAEG